MNAVQIQELASKSRAEFAVLLWDTRPRDRSRITHNEERRMRHSAGIFYDIEHDLAIALKLEDEAMVGSIIKLWCVKFSRHRKEKTHMLNVEGSQGYRSKIEAHEEAMLNALESYAPSHLKELFE